MMHYSIPFADWMAGRHLIANQTLGILEFMQAQIMEDGEMAGRGATTAEAGITLKATSSRSLSPPV
jgi:hypothetical protein